MERVDKEGMLASAETLAKLISAPLSPAIAGIPTVVIYDIHALQERFYFTDNVRLRLVSALPILMEKLKADSVRTVAVFPDDGAAKRFGKHVELPYLVCGKVRDKDERYIRILDSVGLEIDTTKLRLKAADPDHGGIFTPEDAQCRFLIIDDLVNSGGTLVRCAEALRLNGAGRIDAYCTHAVFGHDSFTNFAPGAKFAGVFDTFFVTNSIPEVALRLSSPPFQVLDLTPHMWDVLQDLAASHN
mmetsp:Transcript_8785/g.20132  ORF Transcript_8785/g.20132 Transcript_8785/m.20132 type:complete len:244 (+) Transcript_8785:348-1079(+)